jgi:transcriptional regulator with XRE-family HTH domain
MTSKSFATARKALGWTQAQCATILGVHRTTVAAWECGRQGIPWMACLVLRLAQDHEINEKLQEKYDDNDHNPRPL